MTELTEHAEAIRFYADHPYQFVREIIGAVPTTQQRKVLEIIPIAIKEGKGVSVKSGHGTGKTALESWIIIWWMATRPFPKIPCTAPTQHQLYDVMWAELAKWHKQCKVEEMFDWRKTHFFNKKHSENWYAVAQTSNKPDAMQGFHSEHLLFIIEEASGVPSAVLEVVEGTQTQENALIMMFGNPTQITGGFYDSFHTKRQYYYTFTFNSEKSHLVRKAYCEKIANSYGKDSDMYRVRVLGEFPKAEPDTLIPISRCEKAVASELEIPDRKHWEDVEIGVDVARYGDAETAIYSRIGNVITEEKVFREKRSIMYVVGEVVKVIRKYEGKHVMVNVDDSGLGGGVTDRLQELAREDIIRASIFGVNNGAKANDSTYFNVGAEMWFRMREWLLEGKIPDDNDLVGQLSSRKYSINSSGKHVIETKEHMRDRDIKSPDRADGAILTLRSLIYGLYDNAALSYAC